MKKINILCFLFILTSYGCSQLNDNLIKAKYLKLIENPDNNMPFDNQLTTFQYQLASEKIKDSISLEQARFEILKHHMIEYGAKNIDTLYNHFKSNSHNKVYQQELESVYEWHIKSLDNHLIKPYKEINGNTLDAHVFYPEDTVNKELFPVIVLYHGGGWSGRKVHDMFIACEHFSKKGIVAVAPEIRRIYRHGVYVPDCVEDAKSIIRWLRVNSSDLKIDSSKIAAAGFSGGGHLVGCTGLIDGFENEGEDLSNNSKPNAMVFYMADFNPNNQSYFGGRFLPKDFARETLSPFDNIKENLPPSIVLHGTKDKICKFQTAVDFVKKMNDYGNDCKLYEFNGHGHILTSTQEGAQKLHDITDNFLESLGYYEQ